MSCGGARVVMVEKCMEIFESCSFQDITGQRISKVLKTLAFIEGRLDSMVKAADAFQGAAPPAAGATTETPTDQALLNGPQLPGKGLEQKDIDAVVVGTGMIGLLTLQAAKIAGFAQVIAVDTEDARLDVACELGATHRFNAKTGGDLAEFVKSLTKGQGADAAFECVGLNATVLSAIGAVRKGGTVTLKVVDTDGNPIEGVEVTVVTPVSRVRLAFSAARITIESRLRGPGPDGFDLSLQ